VLRKDVNEEFLRNLLESMGVFRPNRPIAQSLHLLLRINA
jgi:hypothetical protein